jgi:hypothetical protein
MQSLSLNGRALMLLALAFAVACERPTGLPDSSASDAQKLPFDRESSSRGISPSQSLVPASSHLPEGTTIVVRLRKELSSASSHAGDSFEGALDEPVTADAQALIARGATVTGRVLDAKPSSGRNPGYLRIALVSVDVAGKTVLIDTSSIFVKAKVSAQSERVRPDSAPATNPKEIVFTPDRRLTFRLAQPADLP